MRKENTNIKKLKSKPGKEVFLSAFQRALKTKEVSTPQEQTKAQMTSVDHK